MGLVLKILVLVLLPVPLVLWAILGIVGSLLAGTGHGFFAPLISTFEGVGQNVTNKCYHCFVVAIALWKSPYMLFKGWKRLLEDLIGREGPLLETVCVPFAGLAILLWPLAVIGAVISAIIASFFLGFYGGIVVLQVCHKPHFFIVHSALITDGIFLYPISVGSLFARPRYRRNMSSDHERKEPDENDNNELKNRREDPSSAKIVLQQSRTLRWPIQEHKAFQVKTFQHTISSKYEID
ncbi:hypothetical protein SLEP1_g50431 [Rubroshorea leprosula]|uniref:Uncharacterized protein n=1 Tax=Rubroshorea leprosula TaxID=152421 RepID=A0AAV5M1C5_9ROSI|nr:hypothetical protein SLEP1_g50431 [Rubroshorea leprosula]